jgi:hypothetical protein
MWWVLVHSVPIWLGLGRNFLSTGYEVAPRVTIQKEWLGSLLSPIGGILEL